MTPNVVMQWLLRFTQPAYSAAGEAAAAAAAAAATSVGIQLLATLTVLLIEFSRLLGSPWLLQMHRPSTPLAPLIPPC